jgi:hypothetical protein
MDTKPRKTKKSKKGKKRAAAGLPASVKGLLRYMEGSQAQISRTPRSTPMQSAGLRDAQNINIKLKIGQLPQQQLATALASATAPLIAARQQTVTPIAETTAVRDIAKQLGQEQLERQKLELGVQREVFNVEQKIAQQASSLRKEFNEEALKFLAPERQVPRITLPSSDAPAPGEEVIKVKRARRSRPVEVKEERIEVAVAPQVTETEKQQQQKEQERFMPAQFLGIGATGEIAPQISLGAEKYIVNQPTGEIVLKDKPSRKKTETKPLMAIRGGEDPGVYHTGQTVRSDLASRVASIKAGFNKPKQTPTPDFTSSASFAEMIEQQKQNATKSTGVFTAGVGSVSPTKSPFSLKATTKLFTDLTGGEAPKFRTTGVGARKTLKTFSEKLQELSKTGANASQIQSLIKEYPSVFEGSVS